MSLQVLRVIVDDLCVGLLAEIKSAAIAINVPACGVGKILVALEEADVVELQRALDDPDIHGTVIAAVLTKHEFKVTGYTVQRHRRRLCTCHRLQA